MAETSTESLREEAQLPKLSTTDFRVYNRMAEHMDYFVSTADSSPSRNSIFAKVGVKHENFRQTWKVLYTACSSGKRPANMSIRQFLATGQQFCHHLHLHHSIEEQHIFPVLAKKMPAFRKELELLTQHKQIHCGLETFQAYLEDCTRGDRELRLGELKGLMDTFGDVLWAHLADEVRQLGAENMRQYWSLEEMRGMPM